MWLCTWLVLHQPLVLCGHKASSWALGGMGEPGSAAVVALPLPSTRELPVPKESSVLHSALQAESPLMPSPGWSWTHSLHRLHAAAVLV